MSLKNFGGVLEYAIELEKNDADFFRKAAENPDCSELQELLERFEREDRKNVKALTRARQENVTEMILEPVQGLDEQDYLGERPDPASMSRADVLDAVGRLEDNAQRFYLEAAERIKSLSDVGRTFQRLAKKRKARSENLKNG